MLARMGTFLVSLLISNWIYSEALIFVPELEPVSKRLMQVLKLPTHDEWPGIMQSQNAVLLGKQIHGAIGESPFSGFFKSIGVLDGSVQSFFSANGFFSFGADSVVVAENSLPYRTGADMFRPMLESGLLPGGYTEIRFR